MEPKFQSSFIPKGPLVSTANESLSSRRHKEGGLFSFIAVVIFTISIVLAIGVFGYKFYLKYSIEKMGAALDEARAALQPEVISELTRFDNRIISTKELVSKHRLITPLFEFLETSTPRTVRFSDFHYSVTAQGLELQMKGEARGYAALALQADIFSKSEYFKNPLFGDLSLNERGEVIFSFSAVVDESLISYQREVELSDTNFPVAIPAETVEETSTTSTATQN
ncbi:MAG: hypothetical protein COV96_01495 [Candidatus Zambryskibacteria bacterium CG11_big_fil_rev_8_21_14_0_20_42_18]|nr:MAG: hypothetical protein COV96_01495 [Candidatus Zambryskibacteria bacterium CG11_big_fil_rev_8_21_14_0_20_42_18]